MRDAVRTIHTTQPILHPGWMKDLDGRWWQVWELLPNGQLVLIKTKEGKHEPCRVRIHHQEERNAE